MASIPRGGGIYRIDGPGGHVYIGSTGDLAQRWRAHQSELNRGIHNSPHLQNAWKKYGGHQFTFSVIEHIKDVDRLLEIEQIWINILHTSLDLDQIYNISRVAESRRGIPISEETRRKLIVIGRSQWDRATDSERAAYSERARAVWARKTDDERAKFSAACKARWERRTQSERAQISARLSAASSHKGKPKSDEVKRKLSKANTGKARTTEGLRNLSKGHRRGQHYTMIAPDGTVYDDIDSLASFGKEHGMSRETVHNILVGKYKNKAGWRGFIEYKEDDDAA